MKPSSADINSCISFLPELHRFSILAKTICRPNPAVAAVVIKDGKLLGSGYTQAVGASHAEVMAIRSVENDEDLENSILLVSLTPCCFLGRTPACTDLILKSKIKSVVVLFKDPNPKVYEKSESILLEGGVTVTYLSENQFFEGLNRDDKNLCLVWLRKIFWINLDYFKRNILDLPSVTVKYAMALDGKMADYQGRSKWITGKEARARVHLERSHHDAIMVGAKTFIDDNPRLNIRDLPSELKIDLEKVKSPLPLIVISREIDFKLIENHELIVSDSKVVFILPKSLTKSLSILAEKILERPNKQVIFYEQNWYERDFLNQISKELEIHSIYVEGGPSLQASLIKSGLVDQVSVYLAPVMFLGQRGTYPLVNSGDENPISFFPPQELKQVRTEILAENNIWIRGIYPDSQAEKIWERLI